MSHSEHVAAAQFHPVIGQVDNTGQNCPLVVTIDGTSQNKQVPSQLLGHFLDIRHSNSGEMRYGFSFGAAATINMADTSDWASPDANVAVPIPVGGKEVGRVPFPPDPNTPVFLNWRCAASGGQIVAWLTDRPAP